MNDSYKTLQYRSFVNLCPFVYLINGLTEFQIHAIRRKCV